tara:strand:+ start:219 stop:2954 length:2736 start_codon:yes stop_codon:yes gene_type:complete
MSLSNEMDNNLNVSNATTYRCDICDKTSSQKSHHDLHLQSDKHKQQKIIFKLELQQKTTEELQTEYKTTDIDAIIRQKETVKIINKDNVKENKVVKQKLDGTVIWKLSKEDETDNQIYIMYKQKLESIIKRCHQVLYNNGSITGVKAMNDIMRILTLKLLEPLFNDSESVVYKQCKAVQSLIDTEEYNRYMSWCNSLHNLWKANDDFSDNWDELLGNFILKNGILSKVYDDSDRSFNCRDNQALLQLVEIINELEISSEFMEAFATSCGDIHEMFTNYGGKTSSKELGAFFTPRKLINVLFNGMGIKDMIVDNYSGGKVFDPCMGTAGFLTRAYNLCNKNVELHGCETSLDTIKFAFCSVLLTTGKMPNYLEKCDSLSESQHIHDPVDVIITNPPFGTRVKYSKTPKVKEGQKEKYEKMNPNSKVSFTDIYPIKSNDGATLFTEMCVYKLKENGLCVIVLPDGKIFEGMSKQLVSFRKWLCDSVNITHILKVPGGTFPNAGVATNVVIFKKNGSTQSIEFLETTKKCDSIKKMITISIDDMKKINYSLDIMEYIEEEEEDFNVPMVKLGDILKLEKGNIQSSKRIEGDYKLVSLSDSRTHNEYKYDGENVFVSCISPVGKMKYYNGKCHATTLLCNLKLTSTSPINAKYIYYILNENKKVLECCSSGAQRALKKDKFLKIKIPLPSIEIQNKIVEQLDELYSNIETIETRITQLKKEHTLYKDYGRKSEIKDLLKGVDKLKLRDICKINNGTRITKSKSKPGEYPVYGSGNQTFTTDSFNRYGYIIIISRFALSEKCVRIIKGKIYLNDSGLSVTSMDLNKCLNTYIGLYLKNNQKTIYNLSRGAAQRNLNMERFKTLLIPLPSLELQETLIQLFTEKETHLDIIKQKIEDEKKYIEALKILANDIIISYC